jgi:hypothetical protein
LSALLLFFVLIASSQPASAANPIKPSQSRVTHTIKDANGVAYKVYFAGTQEKKAIASYARWDGASAGDAADEGDQLFTGNYTLYTHNPKTSHIKKTKFYYPNYLLNATRKMVHIYPSKYKGQLDILAVSQTDDFNWESAEWYYMKGGELTHLVGAGYTKRATRIAFNEFRTAWKDVETGKWYYSELVFDPKNNTFAAYEPLYSSQLVRDWPKHWQ